MLLSPEKCACVMPSPHQGRREERGREEEEERGRRATRHAMPWWWWCGGRLPPLVIKKDLEQNTTKVTIPSRGREREKGMPRPHTHTKTGHAKIITVYPHNACLIYMSWKGGLSCHGRLLVVGMFVAVCWVPSQRFAKSLPSCHGHLPTRKGCVCVCR